MTRIYTCALSSLTILAVTGTAAFAEQATIAPTLEGGVTAAIGAMYVVPSAANDDYATSGSLLGGSELAGSTLNVDPDYEFGLLASLGYVFDNTANAVELAYRGLFDSSSTSSASVTGGDVILPQFPEDGFDEAKSKLEYEYHSVDLMFSQFMNLGEHVQVRFSAGASYVDLEQKQSSDFGLSLVPSVAYNETTKSEYTGFGPRVGIDGRYDFGQGFGILAGGSAAYYLGDLDTKFSIIDIGSGGMATIDLKNNKSDHSVTNLRGHVAVDYVYFLDNEQRSTVGIEVGYMSDWYDDIVGSIGPEKLFTQRQSAPFDTHSVSFTGPYAVIKGAF